MSYFKIPFLSTIKGVKNDETGKEGLVDALGNVLVPCEQDRINRDCSDGYIFFEKDGKVGVYCIYYGVMLPAVYDEVEEACTNEWLRMVYKGKSGYVTTEGHFFTIEEFKAMTPEEVDKHYFIMADIDEL